MASSNPSQGLSSTDKASQQDTHDRCQHPSDQGTIYPHSRAVTLARPHPPKLDYATAMAYQRARYERFLRHMREDAQAGDQRHNPATQQPGTEELGLHEWGQRGRQQELQCSGAGYSSMPQQNEGKTKQQPEKPRQERAELKRQDEIDRLGRAMESLSIGCSESGVVAETEYQGFEEVAEEEDEWVMVDEELEK